MKGCTRLESGIVELYFYDELSDRDRAAMVDHLATCHECRQGVEELEVIRTALLTRPVVSAPPGGDWSGFMARLETAVASGAAADPHDSSGPLPRAANASSAAGSEAVRPAGERHALPLRMTPYLAIAATLVLAAAAFVGVARSGWGRSPGRASEAGVAGAASVAPSSGPVSTPAAASEETIEAAFAALSEQHFERSKLVVLGIASKDASRATRDDWEYERQLARILLTDTRLYRLAAEERGMKRIASVMSDLELVLLQTSLGAESGPEDLAQIQRLIDRRDLVTKMELAAAGI